MVNFVFVIVMLEWSDEICPAHDEAQTRHSLKEVLVRTYAKARRHIAIANSET